jgi:hypothetical protein
MKKILTIILILTSIFCNCQKNVEENKVNKKGEKKITLSKNNDTLKLKNVKKNEIVIVKFDNKEEIDYFKYIFPIITLLLGIAVNKLLEYISEYRKIRKSAKRWNIELRNLETPLENQISSIDEFLIEHNKDIFQIPNLVIEPFLSCETFKSLEKTELIKYIEKVKSKDFLKAIKDINAINSYTNSINYYFESLKTKYNDYLKGSSLHTFNLSKNLQELLKSFANYGVELEKELNIDPLNNARYKPIFDLFEKEIRPYIQDGNYDIFKLEKDFFIPLLNILALLRLDPKTLNMAEDTRNCINDIKGIKMEKFYLTKNFENFKVKFVDFSIELPEIYNRIE